MSLLLREHVDTAINCGSVGILIRPLLCIEIHVLGKQIRQLIIFLHARLLIVSAGEMRRDVEGGAGSGSVGYTHHRGGTNTACAKARKKGGAMTGGWGGGHG
jgi:hypothetical protein